MSADRLIWSAVADLLHDLPDEARTELVEARQTRGLSQSQAAREIGVTQATLSRWEAVDLCDVRALSMLAAWLGQDDPHGHCSRVHTLAPGTKHTACCGQPWTTLPALDRITNHAERCTCGAAA